MINKQTLIRLFAAWAALALLVLSAQAQSGNRPVAPDTTEIKINGTKVMIIKDEDGRSIKIQDNDDPDVLIDDQGGVSSDYDDLGEIEVYDESEDWDDFDYEPKEATDEKRKSNISLLGLDLGISNYYVDGNYATEAATPELALREFRPGAHVALHMFPTRVSLAGRGAVNLKTAVTIDWTNFYFENNITLQGNTETLTTTIDSTVGEYSVNKLTSRYVQIPLLLNINTDPGSKKGLSISVGGFAGFLWSGKTKQVSEENGKVKRRDDFNLNPIRYGLMARFDFRWLDVYFQYNLSEVFAENEGPGTQMFAAGLNVLNF
ncbi:MAG: porin family protein [Bacteroidota bacterium]